jgi:hypothetical protein
MNVYQCQEDNETEDRGHLLHNIGNAKEKNSIFKGETFLTST